VCTGRVYLGRYGRGGIYQGGVPREAYREAYSQYTLLREARRLCAEAFLLLKGG